MSWSSCSEVQVFSFVFLWNGGQFGWLNAYFSGLVISWTACWEVPFVLGVATFVLRSCLLVLLVWCKCCVTYLQSHAWSHAFIAQLLVNHFALLEFSSKLIVPVFLILSGFIYQVCTFSQDCILARMFSLEFAWLSGVDHGLWVLFFSSYREYELICAVASAIPRDPFKIDCPINFSSCSGCPRGVQEPECRSRLRPES